MNPLLNVSAPCGADLSLKKGYAVKLNNAGALVLAGAGEAALGILYRGDIQGKMGTVMVLGIALAKLGAAVNNAGTLLAADVAGKLVTAAGGDNVIAVSADAGGASGDEVRVIVCGKATVGTGLAASYSQICIPVNFADLDNKEVLTDFVPGYAGEIVKAELVVVSPATTADKAAELTLDVEATPVTGGTISPTSANTATMGAIVAGTAITADNTFTNANKISIKASNVGTPFIEGTGVVILTLKQA